MGGSTRMDWCFWMMTGRHTFSMVPAGSAGDEAEPRIARWHNRQKPNSDWAPGDPRRLEELYGKKAELTELGRKLLGLDAWQ